MADRRSAATKAQAAANPGGDQYKAPPSSASSSSTSKVVMGGEIVQVNTGSHEDLVRLNAQRPGSRIVTDPNTGQEKLIETRGKNLQNQSNYASFNAKRIEEGKQAYGTSRSDYLTGTLNNPGIKKGYFSTIEYNRPFEAKPQLQQVSSKIPTEFQAKPLLISTPQNQQQRTTSQFAYDEGGTVTYRTKKYFSRESRNQIKDFLRSNPAESYNLFYNNKKIGSTSGRNAYPDILKFSLSAPISIMPVTKENKNAQYVSLGPGVPLLSIENPLKENAVFGPQQLDRVYGPSKKPDYYRNPDRTITGAASEALGLLGRSITNTKILASNLMTGKQEPEKYNVVSEFLGATAKTLTPAARELLGVKGVIRKATAEENATATTAFPEFINQTEQKFKENPKEVIFPLAGEILLNVATLGAIRGGGAALEVMKQNKILSQAAKDFRGVISPKDLGIIKVTEKISASPATGLAKTIGGEGLLKTKVSVRFVGGNLVRVESTSIKQGKSIFYDVAQKKAFVVEGVKPESKLPDAFNLRGSLADVTKQQTAQQIKFGLTQESKDLFKTVGKANEDLIKAIKSEAGITHVGNVKTFSLEQVKQDPRAFGRYLFGNDESPRAAITNRGLLETKGPSGSTSIKVNRVKDFIDKDIFKPYNLGKIKIGNELFVKRNPTNTFVTAIQKNIRFQDPFSRLQQRANDRITKSFARDKNPFDRFENKKSSGNQILTKTKEQRDTLSKIVSQEKQGMDILFSKPRFTEGAGVGGVFGITHQIGIENPNTNTRGIRDKELGLKSNNRGLTNRIETSVRRERSIFDIKRGVIPSITNKNNQGIITSITPKQNNRLGVIPSTSFEIFQKQNPIITPKITPQITQIIRQRTPTTQTTITKQPEIFQPPEEKIIIERIPGIFGWGDGPRRSGNGGGRSEGKSRFNWVGNVPQEQVEGIFGRQSEISYGRMNTSRVPKHRGLNLTPHSSGFKITNNAKKVSFTQNKLFKSFSSSKKIKFGSSSKKIRF